MPSVNANGITIGYETFGDGEPLLLIMGLGAQLTDWPDGFLELLVEQGFGVIAMDNRDQGLSTEFDWDPPSQARSVLGLMAKRPPKTGYLLADMADDAAGLLEALNVDSAHIVGASMGGMIAQSLAIGHPERVRSLTSIMSNTGDRKHGGIAPRLLPAMARMPEPTRETAVERSIATFKLIGGPHWDEARTQPGSGLPPQGDQPANGRHHGQPRSHRRATSAQLTHPGDPWAGRPAGPPHRRHRHRQGRPRFTPADVSGYGP